MLRLISLLNSDDFEDLLTLLDSYIMMLVRKYVPRGLFPPETLEDEIEEIAQKTRIKLWLAWLKGPITNCKAYVRRIVQSQCVDVVRSHRPYVPLSTDEDGELQQGKAMITLSEDMQDPANAFEQKEKLAHQVTKATKEISSLPRVQQSAFICSLKESISDTLPLLQALSERGINVKAACWSKKYGELQSQRSSLSIARKKLRSRWRKQGLF